MVTSEMPFKTRAILFLYGSPNIIGCLCALVVLGLFFAGLIRSGWLMLTLGAWLAGWLGVPRRTTVSLDGLPEKSPVDAMDMIVAEFGARLPARATKRLGDLQTLIHELAPRIGDAAFPADAHLELASTITRDLPDTLNNYLAIPPGFARLHPVQGRKTACELLQEQLDLLYEELTTIANGVWTQEADKLVSQGEYLRQKFRTVDFLKV